MKSVETIDYLPIQKWFMQRALSARNHFNHSFLIRVNQPLDKKRVQDSLEKLCRLHGMLRAVYPGGGKCFLKESAAIEVKELDIREKNDAEIFEELTQWQSRFDLESGYLWQSGILRGYKDGSERIYLAAHHMVIDAASWSIIREELKGFYDGEVIENRSGSYRQWVEAVNEYAVNASDEEKAYWEKSRSKQQEQKYLWKELAEKNNSRLRYTRVEFSREIVRTLVPQNHEANHFDINEVLLSGLAYALHEVSGEKNNWITLEKHGRDAIKPPIDVSRTVGWFTTLFPVCLTVGSNIGETLLGNRERLRKIPGKGTGYGALCGYDNMPCILFNYLEKLIGTEESNWQIRIEEASGESMSPENRFDNIVGINGLGREGKVGLWVESSLKEENHQLLCEAFKRNVEAVANYVHR
jgi:Condensation domain